MKELAFSMIEALAQNDAFLSFAGGIVLMGFMVLVFLARMHPIMAERYRGEGRKQKSDEELKNELDEIKGAIRENHAEVKGMVLSQASRIDSLNEIVTYHGYRLETLENHVGITPPSTKRRT